MMRERPFEAVIADMDGVLTRTAKLHERAWKRMFDEFLGQRDQQPPFTSADYRAHVDGKPRYTGVADFLESRQISLLRGELIDSPDRETVYGLGNRKNEFFLELLEREGVEVFEDAVAALDRWRRCGLKLAVVSSSRNCCRVLRAADLERRVDTIVDEELAEELHLHGKAEIMREAAHRVRVPPADAVILEDATAGVRAGRRCGFGLVVGVARDGNDRDLMEAGAHEVASNAYAIRFLHRIPNAMTHLRRLSAWRAGRTFAVFLDFDGTLAPIVSDPCEAHMSHAMRAALENVARNCPVAIISGRDREDVQARVGIGGLLYAGNHGFDIAGRGHRRTLPEVDEVLGDVELAENELRRHFGCISGVIIERKRYSVAVHFRQVDTHTVVEQVERAVETIRQKTGLRRRRGKKVVELEPAVDWNKGRALKWLMDVMHVDPDRHFFIYIGDDETDEDAFAALGGHGAGIRVGEEVSTSLADYRLQGPEEVQALLNWFVGPSWD